MRPIITKSNKQKRSFLSSSVFVSAFLHLSIVAILLYSSFFSDRAVSVDGDTAIKAVMIDLSVIAASDQSFVEDSPLIERIKDQPIVEEQPFEVTSEKINSELDIIPDLIAEKEIAKQREVQKDPQIVIKEKLVKPKQQSKRQSSVQKSSQPKVKQEIAVEQFSSVAVAPSLSENTTFSAMPTPVSRHQPQYPRRALDMRIEGHVIAIYDINRHGRVENIRIVEAKPNNIFNRAVIQAMKQWRYQPISAKDLTIRIVFNRNKSIKFEST